MVDVPATYSCEEICNKFLECENHRCKELCHPGNCGECTLQPAMVTHCCCGQTPLTVKRESCLDPTPTCDKICSKRLKCGQPSKYESVRILHLNAISIILIFFWVVVYSNFQAIHTLAKPIVIPTSVQSASWPRRFAVAAVTWIERSLARNFEQKPTMLDARRNARRNDLVESINAISLAA